eukprot:NODE_155_length_15238_cov_1.162560.p2 type:complete len:434 gc:universal NODE_155_length_15238_cov_1.162560:6874-5573(-)
MLRFGNKETNWSTLHSSYREIQDNNIMFEKANVKVFPYTKNTTNNNLFLTKLDKKFPYLTRGLMRWYYWPTEHHINIVNISTHPKLPIILVATTTKIHLYDIGSQKFRDPIPCTNLGTIKRAVWRPCDGYSFLVVGDTEMAYFKFGIEYDNADVYNHFRALNKMIPWYYVIPLPFNGILSTMSFSTDGKLIAFGFVGCSNVFLYDMILQSFEILSYRGSAPCTLSFSPNNRFLAVGDFSGSLIVINIICMQTKSFTEFQTSITSISWSDNSRFIYFSCKHSDLLNIINIQDKLENCLRLFPLKMSAVRLQPLNVHVGGAVRELKISLNGKYMAISFEPEDDEEEEESVKIVQLNSVRKRMLSTPLIENEVFSTPLSKKYPGQGTPRKTGHVGTPLSPQLESTLKLDNAKEGRNKIAVLEIGYSSEKEITCSIM